VQEAVCSGKIVVIAAHGNVSEKLQFDMVIQMENGQIIGKE
jgi:hypothetical protein